MKRLNNHATNASVLFNMQGACFLLHMGSLGGGGEGPVAWLQLIPEPHYETAKRSVPLMPAISDMQG